MRTPKTHRGGDSFTRFRRYFPLGSEKKRLRNEFVECCERFSYVGSWIVTTKCYRIDFRKTTIITTSCSLCFWNRLYNTCVYSKVYHDGSNRENHANESCTSDIFRPPRRFSNKKKGPCEKFNGTWKCTDVRTSKTLLIFDFACDTSLSILKIVRAHLPSSKSAVYEK